MSEWDWRGRGKEGLPTLATQLAKAPEETRQQYVTTRIQEFQRVCFETGRPVPWDVLRYSFIGYGIQYDKGFRLRHLEDVAA